MAYFFGKSVCVCQQYAVCCMPLQYGDNSACSDSEDYEQNCFLLGQFYTEQNQPEKAVSTFSKIASSENNASIFARQAKYQLSIICFDKGLKIDENNNDNPFNELEKLASLNSQTDLFYVCANYNLGLATFNGYNPNIPSGQVLEVARDYWLKAAGGDVQKVSEQN